MGFIGAHNPMHFERVAQWSPEAEHGLRDCFYGEVDRIRDGVTAGTMGLYKVNGNSWLAAEVLYGKMFFIWCYQGKQLVRLIETLLHICERCKLEQISFFTYHTGVLRALRRYGVYGFPTKVAGECQYVIDVKPALAKYDDTLKLSRVA